MVVGTIQHSNVYWVIKFVYENCLYTLYCVGGEMGCTPRFIGRKGLNLYTESCDSDTALLCVSGCELEVFVLIWYSTKMYIVINYEL